MKCEQCKNDVPDFLWVEGDHPALTEHPIIVNRYDHVPGETTRISATAVVQKKMCSEVDPEPEEKIFDWTTSTEIETAVFQAIGAASVCWEDVDRAGVFDSTRAEQIGKELIEYFKSKGPIY